MGFIFTHVCLLAHSTKWTLSKAYLIWWMLLKWTWATSSLGLSHTTGPTPCGFTTQLNPMLSYNTCQSSSLWSQRQGTKKAIQRLSQVKSNFFAKNMKLVWWVSTPYKPPHGKWHSNFEWDFPFGQEVAFIQPSEKLLSIFSYLSYGPVLDD